MDLIFSHTHTTLWKFLPVITIVFTTHDSVDLVFSPVYFPRDINTLNSLNLLLHPVVHEPWFTDSLSSALDRCSDLTLSFLLFFIFPRFTWDSQPWRSMDCRSRAWPSACVELQSASSWRTTVCLCRGRRSWRRCLRRRWQSTTSAACWTRPQMLTRAPGTRIRTNVDHPSIV